MKRLLALSLAFMMLLSCNVFASETLAVTEEDRNKSLADLIYDHEEVDYEVLKPDESNEIHIVMFHGLVTEDKKSFNITADNFRSMLEELYEKNYRLVSLEDIANNNINIPAGTTPIAFTFDDGLYTTFALEDHNGALEVKKDTMVGIFEDFLQTHQDFGDSLTFFVNKHDNSFKGDGTLPQRFEYLIENDYEIGNHTENHKDLANMDAEEIQKEIMELDSFVKANAPDCTITTISYPFGNRPHKDLRQYALNGTHNGQNYSYKLALRAGPSGGSANPANIEYDPLNVPRIIGTDNAKFDLGWFIEYYENNPTQKYISDGNPDTIAVPKSKEANVNQNNLGSKKLILY